MDKLDTYSYQPINSYGVIGDCHSMVLIAQNGSVDWGCLPDFDSPAIFCRLLDAERGGYFQIAPTDSSIEGSQRYLRDSNVLQTRFNSAAGELILTDFMPVETLSAWQFRELNNNTWTREDGSCHSLVRIVECTQGELPVVMTLKVSPDYAASSCEVLLLPDQLGAIISGGQQHVGLGVIGTYRVPSFSMTISNQDGEMHPVIIAQAILHEGDRLLFALGLGRTATAARRLAEQELHLRNFDWELAHTLHWWRTWLAGCTYRGPYDTWVKRSALVLKMMTYAPNGAIVASPTTSLPRDWGNGRCCDYRFTWLHDATFTLYALNVLGLMEEAYAFTHWLRRILKAGEDLQSVFDIRGKHCLTERKLYHLSGYCSSRPVRIGNNAANQKNFSIFGEVLDCIHLFQRQGGFERYGEKLEGPLWDIMRLLVEYVCTHWQETDNGIWETAGDSRHFVHSKVMCWVALDRGIRAAEQLYLEADIARWRQVQYQIRTDILIHGYNPQIGAFIQTYDDTTLDASSLIMPLVGFIAPDDPRMRSTVDRIMEHLTNEHGFVYRYFSYDSLGDHEGISPICTFWLVDNLAMQGRIAEASSLFERLLKYAGHLSLLSEEIDPYNNTALGNYPHALTHMALINSAQNLRKAELRNSEHHTDPVVAAIKLQQNDRSIP
jgi:alpha,alpha-trehalase